MEKKKFTSLGFTLMELLVAIGLLGVLSVTLLSIFNPFLQFEKARDAKRKSDLRQITTLLNEYYNDHQSFPPASNASQNCACGSACYVDSTVGSGWISALSTYAQTLPVDPTNSGTPWSASTYVYSYGHVSCDGQTYDLTTQLENTSDPVRCAVKDYTYNEGASGGTKHWCTNGGSLTQIYEYSPPF